MRCAQEVDLFAGFFVVNGGTDECNSPDICNHVIPFLSPPSFSKINTKPRLSCRVSGTCILSQMGEIGFLQIGPILVSL